MSRTRAADDFTTIRARLDELRRERKASADTRPGRDGDDPRTAQRESAAERYRRERMEGFPPPWVPTIFLNKPHP